MKKEFTVFSLENKITGNKYIDIAYNLDYKIRKLKKIINERTRGDMFSPLFWAEVYRFDDLI